MTWVVTLAPMGAEAIFISSKLLNREKPLIDLVKTHTVVCSGASIIRNYYQDRSKFSTNEYIVYKYLIWVGIFKEKPTKKWYIKSDIISFSLNKLTSL